jgi:soluble lytic murein transglycosylase-like protein
VLEMSFVFLLILTAFLLRPESVQAQDPNTIRAAMRSSMVQQRFAASAQSKSAGARFPIGTPMFLTPPPRSNVKCEALPDSQLDEMAAAAGEREGVSPRVIREVVRQESGGQPCAVSVKGAQGLMQLMPKTQVHFGVENPFNPYESVSAGAKLLKQLLERYQGDLRLALSAYNAGTEVVDRARAVPNILETQGYVGSIVRRLGH